MKLNVALGLYFYLCRKGFEALGLQTKHSKHSGILKMGRTEALSLI